MGKKLKEAVRIAVVLLAAGVVFGQAATEEGADSATSEEAELALPAAEDDTDENGADLISSDKVTPAVLRPVFAKDQWEVREVKGGLKMKAPKSQRVIGLEWKPEKELISFVMWYEFDDLVFKRQKLDLANRINSEVMLTRASVDEDGDLRFDYWIPYSEGIRKPQLLSALRLFERSTEAALRIKDKRDLVK